MASTRPWNQPWRNEDELCKVRNQLFTGARAGEPDERDLACRMVGYSIIQYAARD